MPAYHYFMRYPALDAIFTITLHLGAFGKTREYRRQKSQEARHLAFGKTRAELEAPNFYVYSHGGPDFTPENAVRFKFPAACWSLSAGMRPNSRGVVHLTGSDPVGPVSIDPNYLDDPQDLKDLIAGLSMAREIGNSLALRPFTGREVAPGSISMPELEQFFRDGLVTHWHQSGTAKMGRDAMSVVDGQLKVYGVDGLRIADASILPRVTTGNTMAPCVIIGERAAQILQTEHKL